MPETRILYLLSDLAYVAKLQAGKKAHEFAISDFLQVNGKFLDDKQLIAKAIEKLLTKLEAGTYQLVLPDFLFTNTIVNVEVKDEAAVKEYLKNKLLPDLKINDEDFYINTSILSNYKGTFKVQLTALEKAIVAPLSKALKTKDSIKIDKIAPLSFSTKSLVSLEPSVAILQMGRELFLAQHYIGMDQCFNTDIDHAADFADTIKTLKGVEASLQTVYLLSDALVDDKIKTALKDTLPVQQLADLKDEDSKMPSHVKKIIEAAAKTFAIPEYLLPQFSLDAKYDKELELNKKVEPAKPVVLGEEIEKKSVKEPVEKLEKETKEVKEETKEEVNLAAKEEIQTETLPALQKLDLAKVNEVKGEVEKPAEDVKPVEELKPTKPTKETKPVEVDLAQFANLAIDPSVLGKQSNLPKTDKKETAMPEKTEKVVIKNKSEAGGMLKMIMIAVLSFIVTIAIGIGIGLGYLQISNKSDKSVGTQELSPTPEPMAEEIVEPTPEPVVIDKTEYDLLVVNATTTAGYAGEIATKLETAGFVDVDAKNAKGDYDGLNYLLLANLEADSEASNQALLQEVATATGLTWELSDQISVEDNSDNYQAVLVLGK